MRVRERLRSLVESIRESGRLAPIAVVTTFLPMAGSLVLVVIGYPLGMWLRENPGIGAIGFTTGVAIACGLALMPTNVIGLISGFAFGFDLGLALLMAAIVASATISFLIHRRITGEKVPELAEKHPKANAVYRSLLGEGFWRTTLIILLLRLSIVTPFALTNFILASARVSTSTFLIGTFFGMLPRSGAVVLAGAGLSELSMDAPSDRWILYGGIAATLISIIIISSISRRALDKLTGAEVV